MCVCMRERERERERVFLMIKVETEDSFLLWRNWKYRRNMKGNIKEIRVLLVRVFHTNTFSVFGCC